MKRRSKHRRIIFLILCWWFGGASQAGTLTISTEEFPPYNYSDEGQITGFTTAVVRELMQRLDISSEIKLLPGARAERNLESKPNQLFFSMFRTSERENLYKWIGPIATDRVYFFKRYADNKPYHNLSDIPATTVIATRHEGMIRRSIIRHGFTNLLSASEPEDQVKLVFHQRAELMASTPLEVSYLLAKIDYPPETLLQTQVQLFEMDLYIACSKDIDDKEINRWQAELDALKASAKYQELLALYLVAKQ